MLNKQWWNNLVHDKPRLGLESAEDLFVLVLTVSQKLNGISDSAWQTVNTISQYICKTNLFSQESIDGIVILWVFDIQK